jgi:flavin-dependent dehydrogenase
MQRRNFISNLAVILPAGMVAPKLLLEEKSSSKAIKTNVLVLGGGSAGLFIAQKLKKEKIDTIVLEPSSGISQSAGYNHPIKAAFIRQTDRNKNASVQSITAKLYSEVEEIVTLDFVPNEIRKTEAGYMVTDGTTTYLAEKLVIALPVEMDLNVMALTIQVKENKKPVLVSCKRKNQKNPPIVRTISVAKIDEQSIIKFAREKTQGILAIL